MTFTPPNRQHDILNKIMAVLIVCLVVGAFSLVTVYNSYVNMSHGLADMRAEFQTVQAENAALQKNIFNLVSSDNVKALAVGGSLVQDKNPSYLEINSITNGSQSPLPGEGAQLLSKLP